MAYSRCNMRTSWCLVTSPTEFKAKTKMTVTSALNLTDTPIYMYLPVCTAMNAMLRHSTTTLQCDKAYRRRSDNQSSYDRVTSSKLTCKAHDEMI